MHGKASVNRGTMLPALRDAKKFFVDYRAGIETFAKDAPAQIERDGAELKLESERAVAAKDFAAFIQNEGKIESIRYRIHRDRLTSYFYCAFLLGREDLDVIALARGAHGVAGRVETLA